QKLSDQEKASATLSLSADAGSCNFEALARRMFPEVNVTAENLNFAHNRIIFEDSWDFAWEVDDAIDRIVKLAIPKIRHDSAVHIELRVSESPEIRQSIAEKIRNQALSHGADAGKLSIQVLCAHKQAYCWIDEILKPRLQNAHRIRIRFRKI